MLGQMDIVPFSRLCCAQYVSIVDKIKVGKLMLIVITEQLVEELSQELDELRSFKSEFMSKSKSGLPTDVSLKHRRQLEALVTHLKQVLLAVPSCLDSQCMCIIRA